jgi:hypothetical protein
MELFLYNQYNIGFTGNFNQLQERHMGCSGTAPLAAGKVILAAQEQVHQLMEQLYPLSRNCSAFRRNG